MNTGMKGTEQRERYSRPSMICSTRLSLSVQIMAFTTMTEYQFLPLSPVLPQPPAPLYEF